MASSLARSDGDCRCRERGDDLSAGGLCHRADGGGSVCRDGLCTGGNDSSGRPRNV